MIGSRAVLVHFDLVPSAGDSSAEFSVTMPRDHQPPFRRLTLPTDAHAHAASGAAVWNNEEIAALVEVER